MLLLLLLLQRDIMSPSLPTLQRDIRVLLVQVLPTQRHRLKRLLIHILILISILHHPNMVMVDTHLHPDMGIPVIHHNPVMVGIHQ
jgi:hypothetical protein